MIFDTLYYIGYKLKKSYVTMNQKKLPFPVVSVGNITTGGTGKTPMTIAIANEALKRGLSPCILTRGYKGRMKGPCFVSRGVEALLDYEDAGDEPVLMAQRLKGVPIVKCADRYAGGLFAIDELRPNEGFIFILDDGFQHWRLRRDKDILLLNFSFPLDEERLLPIGSLREPLSEINRADVVVYTKSEGDVTADALDFVRRYNKRAPVFASVHRAASLVNALNEPIELDSVRGDEVFGFCGLADPHSFRDTISAMGFAVIGFREFDDHYAYKNIDIKRIEREAREAGASWILTTEKDFVRIRGLIPPKNLLILGMEAVTDERFYDSVFDFIAKT